MEGKPHTSRLERPSLSDAQRVIRHFLELHKPSERVMRFGNGLKTTIEMEALEQTLSEHVHGMSVLADLVLDTEQGTSTLSRERIHALIRYHDAHETITGDTILKNDTIRAEEREAEKQIEHLESLRGNDSLAALLAEYHEQTTPEALFVKGLDRLEAYLTMMYSDRAEKLNNRITDAEAIAEKSRAVSPLLADTQLLALRFLMKKKSAQKEFDFNG